MQNLSKELIILVGPPGSGKSTFSKSTFPDHVRISQDDQGADHVNLFLKAIKDGKNIVVDRMGFSREQRSRYIRPARDLGYEIVIYDFNKSIESCFKALKTRTEHPTLPSSSGDSKLLEVLDFYVHSFEPVQPWEGDHRMVYEGRSPYMWDVSNLGTNVLIIGDVHGCYDELLSLIKRASSENPIDLVIFCGDLVDKGPKIVEVLKYFIANKIKYISVMGNHENKFKRFLKGNKVSVCGGLQKTIEQMEGLSEEDKLNIRLALLDMPRIIKFCDYYVLHAGINPERKITDQFLESLMYTRNWNPVTKSFNTETDPYWFEYYKGTDKICFGHHIHDQIKVKDNIYAMDGGCVHGGKLRGLFLSRKGYKISREEIYEVQALQEYSPRHGNHVESDALAPYEARASKGLLRKVVDGDLVLYNYTDKCTFERAWDEYTIQARGLIFDSRTKEVVARPFPKFFNINENEATQIENLPKEKFEAFEKMDGSMGIIYNYKDKWRVATRGSFNSDQAIKAQEMVDKKLITSVMDKSLTYLVEIIYPANKIIVDYGDREELVILGMIETKTGKEISINSTRNPEILLTIGFTLPKVFNKTLTKLMTEREFLSKNEEGFVLRFDSGLRVKVKGEEYLKVAKIRAHASPLSFWEVMVDGRVSPEYLAQIPEEILPEFLPVVSKLEEQFTNLKKEIFYTYANTYLGDRSLIDSNNPEFRKNLANAINSLNYEHKKIFFKIYDKKDNDINEYVKKQIKPCGNVLRE